MEQEKQKEVLHPDDVLQRISFLTELLHCNGKIYLWSYDDSGNYLNTNAPNMVLDTMFRSNHMLTSALDFGAASDMPFIISSDFGMMWCATYEKYENQLYRMHVIGPVFSSQLSDDTIRECLKSPKIRASWKPKLVRYLKDIPVITATDFIKYTLMLHYCITQEYRKPSDITFFSPEDTHLLTDPSPKTDYASHWARENILFDMLQKGDIYYKSKLPGAASMMQNMYPSSDRELPRARQQAAIFAGGCIRAAIAGGISPDTAYSRGELYLKSIRDAPSFTEMLSYIHTLYEDLLFLVHNHRKNVPYSKEVQACADYIEQHTEEPLNIDYLARKIGYSSYYLSRKFKTETGVSINSYIKKARIERASILMVSTKMEIQDISDLLQFGNRSFFSKVFKEETGFTPAQFRRNHQCPL